MFKFISRGNFARPIWVVLAAWLALGLAFFARANPMEPNCDFKSADADKKLFFALGMIESGNDDRGIGRAGEVSRYQIHPKVWKNYSGSREFENPEVSLQVAHQHWNHLTNYFRAKAGHEPTSFDMYVLWNTRFGYYARKGFHPDRLAGVIRDRAQRFLNLVDR